MTFGEMLDMLMKEKGLTPTDLHERSGVSKQVITEIVKGRTKEPKFSTAKKLADGLGTTLEHFAELTND